MDLIPKWFSNFPSRSRRPSDILNIGKFFDDMDLGISSSGLSISSDEQSIYIDAHVPGLTAEDVDVSIDQDNVLWIKGTHSEESRDKKRKYYSKSRSTFSYCVPLWDEIDHESEPKATCKDGVMHLTFKKSGESSGSSRKINVEDSK